MIDEFPFSFVEVDGFRVFVQKLNPKFDVPSRRTIPRNVLHLDKKANESLRHNLIPNRQRIALTTDCCTSIQNINYMVIRAHFYCLMNNDRSPFLWEEVTSRNYFGHF